MENFIERHNTKIKGVISCFDRIVLTGTIPGVCYADAMTSLLIKNGVKIFDYTQLVELMREEIRVNAENWPLITVSKFNSFVRRTSARKTA